MKEVRYLGFLLSKTGIRPDQDKTKLVEEFPIPTCVKEVRSFLGLANYYRRFIHDFAGIATPLNALTRKNVPFIWDENCQFGFELLKHRLVTSPILTFPDFSRPFIIQCDASGEGVCAIFCQTLGKQENVISYAGRGLIPAEKKYSATERELLAILFGIRQFRPYIYGQKFTVVTDHSALKKPVGRLARWSLELQDLDFDIVHRAGTKNANADTLSRIPHQSLPSEDKAVEVLTISHNIDLLKVQTEDEFCSSMMTYLLTKRLPNKDKIARVVALTADYYLIDNGLLYRVNLKVKPLPDGNQQLVVPDSIKAQIIQEIHDVDVVHLGIGRTYEVIKQRYYWPNMYTDIVLFIRSCLKCAKRKTPRNTRKAPLTPMPAVSRPFERMAVDVLGPLPKSKQGNRYLVVFCDYLTRWPEVFPVKNQEAVTIANLIIDEILPRHGAPEFLLSDLGSNFVSSLVTEICKIVAIKHLKTSSYRPQTDGLVERFNSTLIQELSMHTNAKHNDWDEYLPQALFAYRISPLTQLYSRIPME
jgi:hypothetical protein